MFTDFLLKHYFKQTEDIVIHLGPGPKVGTIFLPLPIKQFWKKETLGNKLLSIIRKSWEPNEKLVQEAASEILAVEVFGSTEDYGDKLYRNIVWYYHQDWKVEDLNDSDQKKIEGLSGMTILTRIRLGQEFIPLLGLKLALKNVNICGLTHLMLVKIPVISFHFFLEIDVRFSFNSIRKAKHPYSDELIAYLYELLFLQQKIALSLHEYLRMVDHTDKQKKKSVLIMAEISAIMQADLAFTYLKASVEKAILLLGYIFEIKNLDGYSKHKQRLNALVSKIPEKVKQLPYYQFIIEVISSENLDELNNYRSGLLHKRGITDLQPHNYFGENKSTIPLKEIFQVLHAQHSKNTAVLIAILAILTDDLAVRDKPDIDPVELLFNTNEQFQAEVTAAYEVSQKE